MPPAPTWRFESRAEARGFRRIAGLDEVGRGCLAGPVVAAAVILDRERPVDDVRDSKVLTAARRENLATLVADRAVAVGVGVAAHTEVDSLNILKATQMAMGRAVDAITPRPDHLLIDAVHLAHVPLSQEHLIRGDQLSVSIAAASIVAKVVRDRLMRYYAEVFPGFGFESNKGYGTVDHLEAIGILGVCAIHRRSFRGVWDQLPLEFGGPGAV